MRLNEVEKQAFQNELDKIIPQEKEEVMQLTTSWKEEGIIEGLEQGLEQGIEQGKADLVLKMLNHRFGPLDETLTTGIKKLTVAQLDALSIALFDFTAINDILV